MFCLCIKTPTPKKKKKKLTLEVNLTICQLKKHKTVTSFMADILTVS